MIDAYSVPCAPETIASTGPGFAPLTTATGIDSAASDPAGTSIAPRPTCPRGAVAVPTRKSCAIVAASSSVSICTFYHAWDHGHQEHRTRTTRGVQAPLLLTSNMKQAYAPVGSQHE